MTAPTRPDITDHPLAERISRLLDILDAHPWLDHASADEAGATVAASRIKGEPTFYSVGVYADLDPGERAGDLGGCDGHVWRRSAGGVVTHLRQF